MLLVGGSTRMPMVRAMIRQLSGKEPDTSVAADEAVAHGAALRAGLLLAERRAGPPRSRSRTSIRTAWAWWASIPRPAAAATASSSPAIRRIPVTAKRTFKTQKANQQSILVQIVEGESPSPDDCTPIGRCTIRELPPNLPAQSPVDVLLPLRAQRAAEGPRHASPTPRRQVETEFVRENGLTKEHLDGWRSIRQRGRADGVSVIHPCSRALRGEGIMQVSDARARSVHERDHVPCRGIVLVQRLLIAGPREVRTPPAM